MKLARLCEHERFEAHSIIGKERPSDVTNSNLGWCPGGQLVPADARMVNENEVVIVIPEGHYLASFTIAPVVEEGRSFRMKTLSVLDPTKTEPPKDPWDYDP